MNDLERKIDQYQSMLLNQYLNKYDESAELDAAIDAEMEDALYDEELFHAYQEGYEFLDYHQLQRALLNLDRACNGEQHAIDAVLSAFSIIQKNLERAVVHKVENEFESGMERE